MIFKLVEIDLLIVIVEDDYKTCDEKKKKNIHTGRRHNNSTGVIWYFEPHGKLTPGSIYIWYFDPGFNFPNTIWHR